jgi:hypothetical protein
MRALFSLTLFALLSVTAAAQFPGTPAPAAQTSVIPAMPAAAPSAHPWYIKPEMGQWMICVKSYVGERARVNAEALATEIREKYKVPAYLFERGGEEKRREEARYAAELAKKKAEEEAQFKDLMAKLRAEAAAKGMEFIEPKRNTIVPHVKYEEQYAVLIGGWPSMEAARKELEKIRMWEPPANKHLMDVTTIGRAEAGKLQGEYAYINPFQAAMVVKNPVAAHQLDPEGEAEVKMTLKLNADEEFSVLKIQKPWTICVKHFTPPHEVKGKDADRSLMDRLFKPQKDAMVATAEHARSMAKMLRSMKPTREFPYGPFEAYVLHTKNGSLVCVGQFNAAEDPELMKMQEVLGLMKFNVSHDGAKDPSQIKDHNVRLFDRLYAMKVK